MGTDVISKLETMLDPILKSEGLSLYDMDFVKRGRRSWLRIYIDREGGVNHGHCRTVSNRLSTLLDVDDVIPGPYTIEVSSPGLTRKLKKEAHFIKSDGLMASVTFKEGFDGPRQLLGRIEVLEGNRFRISAKTDRQAAVFSFSDVARARLEMD